LGNLTGVICNRNWEYFLAQEKIFTFSSRFVKSLASGSQVEEKGEKVREKALISPRFLEKCNKICTFA
jgi:hypothetical protein